jgi:hypothetical protein
MDHKTGGNDSDYLIPTWVRLLPKMFGSISCIHTCSTCSPVFLLGDQ